MSGIDLFWLLLQIAGLLTAIGFARWWGQRRAYRDGYPIRMTPRAQVEDEPLPAPRITIQHVTPGAADKVEIIDGHFTSGG